jgi:hypothetical protein
MLWTLLCVIQLLNNRFTQSHCLLFKYMTFRTLDYLRLQMDPTQLGQIYEERD